MATPKKRIDEIQQYVIEQFNQDISLSQLADEFELNPNYLSQLFKEKTGSTYMNYLTNLRIDRAKQLLEHTRSTSLMSSWNVGFSLVAKWRHNEPENGIVK